MTTETSSSSPQSWADRAREEGASPLFVGIAAFSERRLPWAAGVVGFSLAVYGRLVRHRGTVLAGGLAFFALLALVPAFISLGAVAALLFDPMVFAQRIAEILADQPEVLDTIQPLLDQIAALGQTSVASISLAGIFSIVLSLYAASKFLYVGRQVLDIAFELEPQLPTLLSRALSMAVMLAGQVLVVSAVVAMTVVPGALDSLGLGDNYASTVRLIRVPLLVGGVYLALTLSLRYGIRRRRAVGWANVGAAFGTVVIVVGTAGLGWYLSQSSTYSQAISMLGGVIALELWLYLICLAVVAAAEIEGVRLGFRRRDMAAFHAEEDRAAGT